MAGAGDKFSEDGLEESELGPEMVDNTDGPSQALGRKGANLARRKSVLGRGLASLMSVSAVPVAEKEAAPTPPVRTEPAPEATTPAVPSLHAEVAHTPAENPVADLPPEGGLIYLSLDRIFPNPDQPRKVFRPEEIEQLSESIRETGLLQPLIVRRKGATAGQLSEYEIIAGERRWRAAKTVGLLRVPAIVKNLGDREALEVGIIENVQRSDLNPVEEARAYRRLSLEFGATQDEIAKAVGKDRASIANTLRLLRLPTDVLNLVENGDLTAGHARPLLGLSSEQEQIDYAKRIVQEQLSVRAVEQLIQRENKSSSKGTGDGVGAETATRDQSAIHARAVEDRLRRALGTKVSVSLKENGRAEVRLSFFSTAELDALLDRLNA